VVFDAGYRIVAANRAYRSLYAGDAEVIGRTCHEVSHHTDRPCDLAGESCPLARARLSGHRERVLHLHHTSQGRQYVDVELVPLVAPGGAPRYYVERIAPLAPGTPEPAVGALIGQAPAFRRMLELVARVAPTDAAVLLLGETGTGKERVARAIHEASSRAAAPLVVVDCASLPETLFESELFGHERGAFTGAVSAKPGLVEAADGGTLFLDELGDVPLPAQVKLLRLLESGTYRRVGGTDWRHSRLRVISATHRDPRERMAGGWLREDLYFRLATFPVHLPPLRERLSDLPSLSAALLERVAPGRHLTIDAVALDRLACHPWPGNVRELRNVIERAAVMADGDRLDAGTIERALAADATPFRQNPPDPGAQARLLPQADGAWPIGAEGGWAALERRMLESALDTHRGTRAELARALGISVRTLYRRLQALDESNRVHD
jgi:DNA-binding NtrC family response regulator